jgi:hypothetical protein
MANLTLVQAINLALAQEMEADDRVIILGEDVGKNGGVFRVTEGLQARFGVERVIDSPLAESGIIGTAIGMAIAGRADGHGGPACFSRRPSRFGARTCGGGRDRAGGGRLGGVVARGDADFGAGWAAGGSDRERHEFVRDAVDRAVREWPQFTEWTRARAAGPSWGRRIGFGRWRWVGRCGRRIRRWVRGFRIKLRIELRFELRWRGRLIGVPRARLQCRLGLRT